MSALVYNGQLSQSPASSSLRPYHYQYHLTGFRSFVVEKILSDPLALYDGATPLF